MNSLMNARVPGLGLGPAMDIPYESPRMRDALLRDAIATVQDPCDTDRLGARTDTKRRTDVAGRRIAQPSRM